MYAKFTAKTVFQAASDRQDEIREQDRTLHTEWVERTYKMHCEDWLPRLWRWLTGKKPQTGEEWSAARPYDPIRRTLNDASFRLCTLMGRMAADAEHHGDGYVTLERDEWEFLAIEPPGGIQNVSRLTLVRRPASTPSVIIGNSENP